MTLSSVELHRAKSSTWAIWGLFIKLTMAPILEEGPPDRCIFYRMAESSRTERRRRFATVSEAGSTRQRNSRPSAPQTFPRMHRRAQSGSTHPCNRWQRESGTREITSMPGLSTSRSGVNCRRAFLIRSRWTPFTPLCKKRTTSQPLIADFALGRRASWQIGVERRAATTLR